MKIRFLRAYFLLTGRCVRFIPGGDGVCVVCRIEPAGGRTPWHLRPGSADELQEVYDALREL